MKIEIIEVGPRDGLQNEKQPISIQEKINFINHLVSSGLIEIEVSSFVSPKWVPQLGDAVEVISQLEAGPKYSALVPNMIGLQRALTTKIDRIALFTAASDAFTMKNISKSIAESLVEFQLVIDAFRTSKPGGRVRGYVSTIFECPYAGRIDTNQVVSIVDSLIEMGVDEISLGDTIGVGVPKEVKTLSDALNHLDKSKIAWHFHDTRGTAIANVDQALALGYLRFDASAAGLGGCPYAPGAGGNLSTEDLVYFAERSGIETGVDLELLANASLSVLSALGRKPFAKAQQAVLSIPH